MRPTTIAFLFGHARRPACSRRGLGSLCAATVLLAASGACGAVLPLLGSADGFGVLAWGAGSAVTISNPRTRITGDVGLGPGTVRDFTNGVILGEVHADPTSTTNRNKIVPRDGTVSEDLSQAVQDAQAASQAAWILTATQAFGDVTGALTIYGSGGLNVISLDSINYADSTDVLKLTGDEDDVFIVNVTGSVTLTNALSLITTEGVPISHVLFNLTGTGEVVRVSGGAHADGTFLAPSGAITVASGNIVGAVLAGGNIGITSGSTIQADPYIPPYTHTPEPGTLLVLAAGAAMMLIRRRPLSRKAMSIWARASGS